MANYEIVDQDETVRSLYTLLETGKAFDKTVVSNAAAASAGLGGLKSSLDILSTGLGSSPVADITDAAAAIGTLQSTTGDLKDHLDWHFDNLITNLGVATSFIGDSIGFGGAVGASPNGTSNLMASTSRSALRAAAPAASPCDPMQNMFGSIMGKASSLLGGALGGMTSMLGQVTNMLGGGILSSLTKSGALAGLSGIPGIGQIGSMLGNLTNGAMTGQIGSMLSSIAAKATGGQLGSVLGQIGSLTNLSNLGGLMTNISSLSGKIGGIVNGGSSGGGGSTGGGSGGSGGLPNIPGLTGALAPVLGQFQAISGQLTGIMGAIGSGNIGSLVGSLGSLVQGQIGGAIKSALSGAQGTLGQISGLISGEKGALGAAVNKLVAMAGAINLPRLWANTCGAGVLDKVATDDTKKALGGSSDGSSGGGSGSGSAEAPSSDKPVEYPQTSSYESGFSNANVSGGVPSQSWNDVYPLDMGGSRPSPTTSDVSAVFSPTPIGSQNVIPSLPSGSTSGLFSPTPIGTGTDSFKK